MREQLRVRREAPVAGFGVPTLVLHGLDDGLVPATASDVLDGAPGVERRTYPGLRHELHNEPEGSAIIDEVDRVARAHARPARPQGTRRPVSIRVPSRWFRCPSAESPAGSRAARAADGWRNVRQASSRTAPKPNRLAIAPDERHDAMTAG